MGEDRLLTILLGVADNLKEYVAREGMCPFCTSFPHEDGSISHDEDCCVPEVEAALRGRRVKDSVL